MAGTGDTTMLLTALLACLLGYGEVGLWLKAQASEPNSWVKLEGNPYQKWMEDYSGDDYQAAVRFGLGQSLCCEISLKCLAYAAIQRPSRLEQPLIRRRPPGWRNGGLYGSDVLGLRKDSGTWL
jgi:hypothetical protein